MLAKKFALGFGIAIVLPMMVHYGVSTITPCPKPRDYRIENYYERHKEASPEEKIQLRAQKNELENKRRQARQRFERHLFFVAVPVGIAAIIIGSLISIQAIGTGLMFGGIFTTIVGYSWYWSELQDWMRFVSLLIAFVILIFIGYRKLAK